MFGVYELLRHAVFSVLRNIAAGFAFAWPWLIVLAVTAGALGTWVWSSGFGQSETDRAQGPGPFLMALVIGVAAYATAFSSIAVNWHRYVLLDDASPGVSRLRLDGHVWRYMWKAFQGALLSFVIILVPATTIIGLVVSLATGVRIGQEQPEMWTATYWVSVFSNLVLTTMFGAIFFRYSLALPAAALGRDEIGLAASWKLTSGMTLQMAGLAAGSWCLQFVYELILGAVALASGASGSVLALCITVGITVAGAWFFTFFGITLLTSLYGHIVEDRAL